MTDGREDCIGRFGMNKTAIGFFFVGELLIGGCCVADDGGGDMLLLEAF